MSTPLQSRESVFPEKKNFPSSSGQMFEDYFSHERKESYKKHELIDARARRMFENTALACSYDAYPFQPPLSSRTGPMVEMDGHQMLMLSSYDYLGLIGDPRIDEAAIAAIRKYGTATGGARLLAGTMDLHREVEQALAEFKGAEAALTFTSGYSANLAVISGLFGPADRVIMDIYSHRSLLDACLLAGVQVQKFEHNDPVSLRHELEHGPEANRTLIVSDGVFSMDGDIACLPELIALKKEFGAYLLMDDAHAIGVLGATGRGVDEHFGIPTDEVDIWTGSLAKSIPSTGGFVAVSQRVAIYLQHGASPFIFSAAMPAAAAAAVLEGIKILKQEPERVAYLASSAAFLREGLQSLGYDTGLSETAVIPVMMHDDAKTALFARRLRDYGVLVSPVLFPAVAQGSARLRLCVTAAHTREHLEFVLDAFNKIRKE
ncbi:MAG TPA: aminotransferase class I/II-fold pyridoxal phosphate-dependent enzyme [Acidobacteriaceae bacterium]|nr:aminotransferase class I/II-fold pyridoxal phosphate-dependent enzyme [Acidobacteriaceae bacterium]